MRKTASCNSRRGGTRTPAERTCRELSTLSLAELARLSRRNANFRDSDALDSHYCISEISRLSPSNFYYDFPSLIAARVCLRSKHDRIDKIIDIEIRRV